MPSAIAWSRVKSLLAVGTTKGAAFVYNYQQKRKILIETKHTKAIIAVQWMDIEHFVLASEDKQVHKRATLPCCFVLIWSQISLNCATTKECLSTMNFKQQITELHCFIQPNKPVTTQNHFKCQYLASVVCLRCMESQFAAIRSLYS